VRTAITGRRSASDAVVSIALVHQNIRQATNDLTMPTFAYALWRGSLLEMRDQFLEIVTFIGRRRRIRTSNEGEEGGSRKGDLGR
jgi:hypothetical protein